MKCSWLDWVLLRWLRERDLLCSKKVFHLFQIVPFAWNNINALYVYVFISLFIFIFILFHLFLLFQHLYYEGQIGHTIIELHYVKGGSRFHFAKVVFGLEQMEQYGQY